MNAEVIEKYAHIIHQFRKLSTYKIKLVGTGGQGIILAGYILGNASIIANINAIQVQSYGAATRGSDVSSDVILRKEGQINYPVVKKMDLLVVFTQSTFDYYRYKVKPGGIILADEDLVPTPQAKAPVIRFPATRLAHDTLLAKIVANVVMLGAIIELLGFIPIESVEKAIKEAVPQHSYEENVAAFHTGLDEAREKFQWELDPIIDSSDPDPEKTPRWLEKLKGEEKGGKNKRLQKTLHQVLLS